MHAECAVCAYVHTCAQCSLALVWFVYSSLFVCATLHQITLENIFDLTNNNWVHFKKAVVFTYLLLVVCFMTSTILLYI